MAIEERVLADFSGGEVLLRSSLEAQENQWLSLEGFVLDDNNRLRSQWEGKPWQLSGSTFSQLEISDVARIGQYVVAKSPGSGWYFSELDNSLEQPAWEEITTPDTQGELSVIGEMAYQVVDGSDVFWVDALLCNSSTVETVNPFAIYVDPRDDLLKIKEWSNTFPNDEEGTADSMPRAGKCTMWGDFLVLGDIIWKADPDEAFNSTNKSRYSHALWFSIPGKPDTWDPIDVIEMGQKSGENITQGLHPLEAGLVVVTKSLVVLLQGPPDDFIYRELRSGISNTETYGSTSWSFIGAVVWADKENGVWLTNGESVSRIDELVNLKNCTSVCAYNEYLFVSTDKNVRVFRALSEGGAWTTLSEVFPFSKIIERNGFLFGLGLATSSDNIAVFNLKSKTRGKFDDRQIPSVIRTRPLPGFGHRVVFWHRFGVRAKGSGRISKTVSRPSADLSDRGFETRINGNLSRRFDYVFDAHGPSVEATFDVEFRGDVTVEHMTIWEHGGRLQK